MIHLNDHHIFQKIWVIAGQCAEIDAFSNVKSFHPSLEIVHQCCESWIPKIIVNQFASNKQLDVRVDRRQKTSELHNFFVDVPKIKNGFK